MTCSGTRSGSACLQDWLAASRGTDVAGVHVTFRDILAHQQIYDPGWPRRWRRHVLSWMARSLARRTPAGRWTRPAPAGWMSRT